MISRFLSPRVFGRYVPLPLVAWLVVVWLLLWGDLSAGNLLGGLAAGAVIAWLLPLPVLDPGVRIRPLGLLAVLPVYAWDMLVSSFRVVSWALRPGPPPTEIVVVRLRTSSESMTMMIITALSSLPGSLVVEAYSGRRELVLHVLGLTGEVGATVQADVDRLERRIVRTFGTGADREELG
ncbi:Na+/H+ antiporter subunit E [Nonomuraea sp. NPDC046570]|uniref:Na+/H+ antiporter subunit E n=1 Tax=Nonomuraea sp. NPDC046570 TaxID=3155255 RepID=UPI0033C9CF7D